MDYKSLLPFSGGRIGSRVGAYDDRFGSLVRELNLLFDEFQRTDRAASRDGTGLPPGGSLDVRDTDTAYEICLGLPEFDERELDVLLADGVLTVKGRKRQDAAAHPEPTPDTGAFNRSLALPADVDEAGVVASFDRGKLTLILPKALPARAKARSIEVRPA